MAFLWKFAVPLTRPVIASFTVISALGAWNQYLWPQAVIDDSRQQTAQIALRTIIGTNVQEFNRGVAAACWWRSRSWRCSWPSSARSSRA